MSDVPNIQQQPVAGSAPARVAPRAQAAGSHADPLAFRALIERLRDQARALEKSAEQPLGAHELPGAVQAAHASLSDALSIADELVEAYRSSAMQGSLPTGRASHPAGAGSSGIARA